MSENVINISDNDFNNIINKYRDDEKHDELKYM